MVDVFTKEKRSEVMSKIRSKGTKPELEVFRYLRRNKVYFQKHYRGAVGSPDIAIPSKKLAVFIDGDFWHGYRFAKRKERLPVFWQSKITMNILRDKKNFAKLRRQGWKLMRVWEHELIRSKKDLTLERIKIFLTSNI